MKEYKNPEYKTGQSKIKSFYTSNNVKSLGDPKIEYSKDKKSNNFNSSKSEYVVNKISSFNTIGLFKIVLVVLLLVSMFRMMHSPTEFSVPTLGALLDSLADAPDINSGVTWFLNLFNVPKFPYPFQWVSNLLGFFVEGWSVVLWIGTASWNIFQFLFHIVRWLFLGV